MDDRILQVKKEINRIVKAKGLIRIEQYRLVKEKSRMLSEKELSLLIREYYREYDSWKRFKDIQELVTVSLTGFGLLIAVAGLYFGDNIEFSANQFIEMILLVGIMIIFFVVIVGITQLKKNKNMGRIKYIIDILESK